jgi:uncharacterized membrane protein
MFESALDLIETAIVADEMLVVNATYYPALPAETPTLFRGTGEGY